MPLIWLSKMLGNPLSERVTGADLVPALAKECALTEHTMYFLGGQGNVAQQAANKLVENNPNLIISGVDAPFVNITGKKAITFEEDDAAVVEKINLANPDILLIAFGNPKQELWFARNKYRLKAGVAIGIGGTFEFITGSVSRAPKWVQKSGCEWIYRISQDPKRLWKRYAIGITKLSALTIPLLFQHWTRNCSPTHVEPNNEDNQIGFNTVNLPLHTTGEWVSSYLINSSKTRQEKYVLNFKNVKSIDSIALGSLIRFANKTSKMGIKISCIGLDNSRVKSLLTLTHTWDFFSTLEQTTTEVNTRPKSAYEPVFFTQTDFKNYSLVTLNGRLDAEQIGAVNIDQIIDEIVKKPCIIDLTKIRFVDSIGLTVFFKLEKTISSRK